MLFLLVTGSPPCVLVPSFQDLQRKQARKGGGLFRHTPACRTPAGRAKGAHGNAAAAPGLSADPSITKLLENAAIMIRLPDEGAFTLPLQLPRPTGNQTRRWFLVID